MAESLRARINAMCKACIYDPYSGGGNWRQQVEACTSRNCPLFPVRPVSSGNKVGKEADSATETEAA